MKTTFKLLLIYNLSFLTYNSIKAQNIGMNGTGANAHPSALVDIDASPSNNIGFLIPRIPLTAINAAAPVTSPATSLLVYNTSTASTGTNAVSPGYYYWDGAKWVRFAYNASGSSSTAWDLLGNFGTNPTTNFLGTTDNQDLVFKRNGVQSGLINIINTSFGNGALNSLNTGASNNAFGAGTLPNNTTGYFNTALGTSALATNTSGFFNTGVGDNALNLNTTGYHNTSIGVNSTFSNTTGYNNTAVGAFSGMSNNTGINNTFLGANADATVATFTNATAIGYNAKVGQSNALILGGTGADAVNVGIGTSTPRSRAQIEGPNADLQISNNAINTGTLAIYFSHQQSSYGTPGSTKGGTAIFTKSAGAWSQSHMYFALRNLNDGADVTISDAKMTILNSGNVGIGTTTPTEKLEVQGSVKIVDGTEGAGKVLTSDATGKGSWQDLTNTIVTGKQISHLNTFPFTMTNTNFLPIISYSLTPGIWEVKYGIGINSTNVGQNFYSGGITFSGLGAATILNSTFSVSNIAISSQWAPLYNSFIVNVTGGNCIVNFRLMSDGSITFNNGLIGVECDIAGYAIKLH